MMMFLGKTAVISKVSLLEEKYIISKNILYIFNSWNPLKGSMSIWGCILHQWSCTIRHGTLLTRIRRIMTCYLAKENAHGEY